jgi:hypothetical protein
MELPARIKFLTEKLLPQKTASNMDRLLPILAHPYTLSALPIRTRDLSDIELPNVIKSNMDNELPKLLQPYKEMDDPTRIKDFILMHEPI